MSDNKDYIESLTHISDYEEITDQHQPNDSSPPRLQLSKDGNLEPEDGQDTQAFENKISRIAGGTTPEEGQALLVQLINASGLENSKDVGSVNSLIAQLYNMNPSDPLEACTMVQLLSSHSLAMKYMRDAHKLSSFNSGEKKAALSVRFSNAFSKQLDSLNKYRRGPTQKIQVNHNHVHMEGESQAIIGDVSRQAKD